MDHQYSGKERRKFKRMKQQHVLMYQIAASAGTRTSSGNKTFNGIMLDLSEDGMAFLTRHKVSKSALVSNKFILINDLMTQQIDRFRPIEAEGRVCYYLSGQRGMFRVGLRFTRLSGDDRGFIKKL